MQLELRLLHLLCLAYLGLVYSAECPCDFLKGTDEDILKDVPSIDPKAQFQEWILPECVELFQSKCHLILNDHITKSILSDWEDDDGNLIESPEERLKVIRDIGCLDRGSGLSVLNVRQIKRFSALLDPTCIRWDQLQGRAFIQLLGEKKIYSGLMRIENPENLKRVLQNKLLLAGGRPFWLAIDEYVFGITGLCLMWRDIIDFFIELHDTVKDDASRFVIYLRLHVMTIMMALTDSTNSKRCSYPSQLMQLEFVKAKVYDTVNDKVLKKWINEILKSPPMILQEAVRNSNIIGEDSYLKHYMSRLYDTRYHSQRHDRRHLSISVLLKNLRNFPPEAKFHIACEFINLFPDLVEGTEVSTLLSIHPQCKRQLKRWIKDPMREYVPTAYFAIAEKITKTTKNPLVLADTLRCTNKIRERLSKNPSALSTMFNSLKHSVIGFAIITQTEQLRTAVECHRRNDKSSSETLELDFRATSSQIKSTESQKSIEKARTWYYIVKNDVKFHEKFATSDVEVVNFEATDGGGPYLQWLSDMMNLFNHPENRLVTFLDEAEQKCTIAWYSDPKLGHFLGLIMGRALLAGVPFPCKLDPEFFKAALSRDSKETHLYYKKTFKSTRKAYLDDRLGYKFGREAFHTGNSDLGTGPLIDEVPLIFTPNIRLANPIRKSNVLHRDYDTDENPNKMVVLGDPTARPDMVYEALPFYAKQLFKKCRKGYAQLMENFADAFSLYFPKNAFQYFNDMELLSIAFEPAPITADDLLACIIFTKDVLGAKIQSLVAGKQTNLSTFMIAFIKSLEASQLARLLRIWTGSSSLAKDTLSFMSPEISALFYDFQWTKTPPFKDVTEENQPPINFEDAISAAEPQPITFNVILQENTSREVLDLEGFYILSHRVYKFLHDDTDGSKPEYDPYFRVEPVPCPILKSTTCSKELPIPVQPATVLLSSLALLLASDADDFLDK